jgi:tetratricopeptide (TPR) repeat protein
MNHQLIAALLEDLKHSDEVIRERATQELWRVWFEQKGVLGLEVLRRAQMMMEMGHFNQAEHVLTQLVEQHPDFAEAWNRRAVLYYTQKQYHQAIADCDVVVQLNPTHFGAYHGLGLCHLLLGNNQIAIRAFHKALQIQPYSLENQRLLLECTLRLGDF